MKKRCLVTKAITIQNLGMNTHSVDSQDSRKVEKRFLEPMPFLYGTDEMVPLGAPTPAPSLALQPGSIYSSHVNRPANPCFQPTFLHFPALSCTLPLEPVWFVRPSPICPNHPRVTP